MTTVLAGNVHSGTQVAAEIKKLKLVGNCRCTLNPGQHWVTVLTLVPIVCPLDAT